jgi:hypothetical protein
MAATDVAPLHTAARIGTAIAAMGRAQKANNV